MLEIIRGKIRALVEDFSQKENESFEYTNSSIFTLSEPNVTAISKVLHNGTLLGSGDYSYDSITNKITLTISLANGDKIEVDYLYHKYSDTELDEYIRASLVYISIYGDSCQYDFELEDDEIFPTPSNKDTDLISLISSILIKPDYTEYRLPNLKVIYDKRIPKEDRISQLISQYEMGLGVNDVLKFDYHL